MVHVHLALDHCSGAAATFTMFWVLLLLLLARRFMFSAFLTAALLLPSTGIVSVLCSFITIDRAILLLLLPLCARTILSHNWKRKERRTKSVERFTIVKCEWNGNEHDQHQGTNGKHLSDVGFDTTNFHGPTPGSMRSSSKEQSSDPLSEAPGTDETGQAMTVMPTLEKSFNINT